VHLIEQELERRPVLTIVILAVVAVSVALGLGIVTPLAAWVLKGKNWAKGKLGTSATAPANPSTPSS
jgi:hypothetical protein